MTHNACTVEHKKNTQNMTIGGIDEAGRGPLAGPVVAAAVVLAPGQVIDGVRDSKQLSAAQRTARAVEIREQALAWAIGACDVAEIDTLNILHATMLAMSRAFGALSVQPERVHVDGNRLPDFSGYSGQATALVGGDRLCPAVSAASIIAKVHRDDLMVELDNAWPDYGFAQHKGYPTRQHRDALRVHGPCPEHRRSFAPVRRVIDAGQVA